MSISERARERAKELFADKYFRQLALETNNSTDHGHAQEIATAVIEQALLAERRLAMEEARLLMCSLCRRNEEFDGQFHRLNDAMTPKNEPYRRVQCASLKLRAAAEKEVGTK